MKCPLCGNVFSDYTYACETCPLNKNCKLICCPHCNYKFPQESKIVNYFNKILKREKKDAEAGN